MGRAFQVRAASMAKTAAAKSKLNAKYGRLIYVAAKAGIPDPESNLALKKEIEKAKKEQVSADVIKRAIEKAKGGSAENYTLARYEGFGPNNSMFIVECLTDNTNRTYTEIRTAFTRCGFKLGMDGSVIHLFKNQAVFSYEGLNDEETLDVLIMAECDVEDIVFDDGLTTVYAPSTEYAKVKAALEEAIPEINFLEDHIAWIPINWTTLSDENDIRHFLRFKATMDELDDVQDFYHNVDEENIPTEE
ncbi:MAG: YebC/PmpR family DNA-binding transcriptional regulator [Bacilli bacterium]|jgi:YebC/PmpR family DNA-binding regulatory protein|nr:YebC/PmpR family DNA-binding transcriptional regulator [Bacilli bacterium]MDY0063622.1 YebC/PmpR family DNA-binding transcriptional regulator [Bacilli bacterium]